MIICTKYISNILYYDILFKITNRNLTADSQRKIQLPQVMIRWTSNRNCTSIRDIKEMKKVLTHRLFFFNHFQPMSSRLYTKGQRMKVRNQHEFELFPPPCHLLLTTIILEGIQL